MSSSAIAKEEEEEDEIGEEEEEEVEEEEEEEEEEDVEGEEEKKEVKAMAPPPPPPPVPSVLESIHQLQTLHSALSDFFLHYNSLQQTLTSIQTNLNSLDPDNKEEETKEEEKKDSESPDLGAICSATASKDLRKYVFARLHDAARLREDVPAALRHAPNGARLVLGAVGRFFVRGRKAYGYGNRNSLDVSFRRTCVLILELYLLAGPDPSPDPSVIKDARVAAMDWKGRMESEGGVEKANRVDALGLVLLVGCFGVPSEFRPEDLCTLLRQSNLRRKADVLRRSHILLKKMPDIIQAMIKKNMQVEAVDLICAFELGENFPVLPLLSSFVQRTCEKEVSREQLVALKSVKKCLNGHKLDASELANLDIDQKIAKLEKEMSMFDRKFQENKRKIEDAKSLRDSETQAKRPWPASTGASYGMIERSGIGLAGGSVHGQACGRHGNEVAYPDSVGQSLNLLVTRYLPGNNFTGHSAVAGQSFYHPPALPHSSVNNFTGHSVVAGQSFYQPPALPHSSMNNFLGQSAAAGQSYYYPSSLSHGMGDVASGKNLYQFADTALQHDPYYGKLATNNAVPTVTNTGHHLQAEYASDQFGDHSFNRSH